MKRVFLKLLQVIIIFSIEIQSMSSTVSSNVQTFESKPQTPCYPPIDSRAPVTCHLPLLDQAELDPSPVIPRQMVSQKLFENRLRRLQIQMANSQQKENTLLRRKQKQDRIIQGLLMRAEMANKARQLNIRETNSMKEQNNQRHAQVMKVKVERLQDNMQKIEKGRARVEQQQREQTQKMHQERLHKTSNVDLRKKNILKREQAVTDKVHFRQWNNYKEQLVKKYQGQTSSPDRLYQQFQSQKLKIMQFARKTVELPKNAKELPKTSCKLPSTFEKEHTQSSEAENFSFQPKISGVSSQKSLMRVANRAQFFGVTDDDMEKETLNDMIKMRKFIQENSCSLEPHNDEELKEKFQVFLMNLLLQ